MDDSGFSVLFESVVDDDDAVPGAESDDGEVDVVLAPPEALVDVAGSPVASDAATADDESFDADVFDASDVEVDEPVAFEAPPSFVSAHDTAGVATASAAPIASAIASW